MAAYLNEKIQGGQPAAAVTAATAAKPGEKSSGGCPFSAMVAEMGLTSGGKPGSGGAATSEFTWSTDAKEKLDRLPSFVKPMVQSSVEAFARKGVRREKSVGADVPRGGEAEARWMIQHRHAEQLARYRSQPGVDPARLTGLINNIDDLRRQLSEAGPQAVNPLKECDFLTAIRHRNTIPGGTCMFDLPDYAYWLHLPASERRKQLDN